MALLLIVLLPLFGALLPLLVRQVQSRAVISWVSALPAVIAFALLLLVGQTTLAGEVPAFFASWLPQLGLDFALRLDGVSLLFGLLIIGIGLLIILYAHYYLSEDDDAGRFYACLLLFMAAMLGI